MDCKKFFIWNLKFFFQKWKIIQSYFRGNFVEILQKNEVEIFLMKIN